MTMKLAALPALALAGLALAGCDRGNDQQLQGWVEAELIFVSPDEQGRVETLKVREGDRVKQGAIAVHRRRRSAKGRSGGEERPLWSMRSRISIAPRNC